MKWTEEQEKAIYTAGTDILVAAAAGSGKTAVLVERIIQKLLNQDAPINIDELLVVTFTNAAAQEMRNRVGAALESALKEHPSSTHLKKQLSLLPRAQISTLHSFCMDVVRKYSYQLDIDPHFRIADAVEADLIRQDALEEMFEEWYGKEGEEQEKFFAVVDRFSSDRSDMDMEELILKLYDFAMQNPNPAKWLKSMTNMYLMDKDTPEEKIVWLKLVKEDILYSLDAFYHKAERALQITKEPDGPDKYADALVNDLEKFQEAKAMMNRSWEEIITYFRENSTFQTLGRQSDCDEEKKKKVQKIRDDYKKKWKAMVEKWFSRSLSAYLEDLRKLHPVMEMLAELVLEFHQRFQAKKKERALCDFTDLEHFCLEILSDSMDSEEIAPSAVALEFQKQFKEILVDEYQDTNIVQETILKLLTSSEDAGNLFMVGDVKQSIYRFRHADPSLFIEKYKRFAQADNENVRIDLSRNFRSRKEVLAATNYIFRQIMDEAVGEIDYDKDAELIYSNTIYDELVTNDTASELLLIHSSELENGQEDGEEDFRDLQKAQLEARAYAQKIKEWIGDEERKPYQVIDKKTNTLRNVQYRDIVILLRSMNWAPTIVEELKNQGIPVYAELSSGYFEAIEVQIMISLLKIIDNPLQDIPLASVLRSPIVGLDEEALAQIRTKAPRSSYYEAVKEFIKQEDNDIAKTLADFIKHLKNWRIKARQGSLSELIWQIYGETGYYDFVGGIPGGKQRQANLRALYDRARSYETTSFRGLFRFLRFIERLEERKDDLGVARALGEQEDVVRIMTIHSSKGLEFPFVIVGAMDKKFNDSDLKGKYLLHKEYGIGMKYIDPDKRIMYDTLPFNALKIALKQDLIAEEMRILYVALTRAKEKLVMVGCISDLEKRLDAWQIIADHEEWMLPAYFRMESATYLNWVGASILRHHLGEPLRLQPLKGTIPDVIKDDESKWSITIHHASEFSNPATVTKERSSALEESMFKWKPIKDKGPFYEEVSRRLMYQYPYQKPAFHRAKQTVTELKRQRERKDEFSEDALNKPFRSPIVKRPRFLQEEHQLTATERGSAMHTVMQHLPLNCFLEIDEMKEEVERMVEQELLTKEEAEVIDYAAIHAFFQTKLGKKLLESEEVIREVPFSLGLPANEVYPDWDEQTEEKVLLQGVIDCLIPEEDGFILLDYKTDHIPFNVNTNLEEDLLQRYQVQLFLYSRAVEDVWNKPVKAAYLYFFDKALLIKAK
jgi:ATP-dependent helicase/nuclease subunit A